MTTTRLSQLLVALILLSGTLSAQGAQAAGYGPWSPVSELPKASCFAFNVDDQADSNCAFGFFSINELFCASAGWSYWFAWPLDPTDRSTMAVRARFHSDYAAEVTGFGGQVLYLLPAVATGGQVNEMEITPIGVPWSPSGGSPPLSVGSDPCIDPNWFDQTLPPTCPTESQDTFILPVPTTQPQTVRMSFKVVRDPLLGGVSNWEWFASSSTSQAAVVDHVNAIWRSADVPLELDVTEMEVVDHQDTVIPLPWFDYKFLDPDDVLAFERTAMADPLRYQLKVDAINVFLNEKNSVAPLGAVGDLHKDLIWLEHLAPPAPLGNEEWAALILAHELGHYFGLLHTHALFETVPAAICPSGMGDCMGDTNDDVDPQLAAPGGPGDPAFYALHNQNYLAVHPSPFVSVVSAKTYNNLMSYHGPLSCDPSAVNFARISCDQRDAIVQQIPNRANVLAGWSPPTASGVVITDADFPASTQITLLNWDPGDLQVADLHFRITPVGGLFYDTNPVFPGTLGFGFESESTSHAVISGDLVVTFGEGHPIPPGPSTVTIWEGDFLRGVVDQPLLVTPALQVSHDFQSGTTHADFQSSKPANLLLIAIGIPDYNITTVPGYGYGISLTPAFTFLGTSDPAGSLSLSFASVPFVSIHALQFLDFDPTALTGNFSNAQFFRY